MDDLKLKVKAATCQIGCTEIVHLVLGLSENLYSACIFMGPCVGPLQPTAVPVIIACQRQSKAEPGQGQSQAQARAGAGAGVRWGLG